MLGLSPQSPTTSTRSAAVQLDDLVGGVFKASVYGVLIALFGCLRGMQSGSSSSAVGDAATIGRRHQHRRRSSSPAASSPWSSTSSASDAQRPRRRATTDAPSARITVRDLTMAFGDFVVMRDLNFTVKRGDVFIIMGGSGCGKSTLLRHMIGLNEPAKGEIFYGDESFTRATPEDREQMLRALRRALPERRAVELDDAGRERRPAARRVHRPHSPRRSARSRRSSSRWSGSRASRTTTRRRSAAACRSAPASRAPWRSIPTSCSSTSRRPGLDPISSRLLDDLILELRASLGATIVVVTHELASIFAIGNNSVFLDAETRTMIAQGDPKRARRALVPTRRSGASSPAAPSPRSTAMSKKA